MIPKRMYFYWGGSNLSWMRYMTLYSFRKMNPDWEIVLCLSKINEKWSLLRKQDFLDYKGPDYFNKISELNITIEDVQFPDDFKNKFKNVSPIHESDLYRYYKLYDEGGFYSDMDILYFRSMDSIYDEIISRGSNTILYQCPSYVAIGFLGAAKDNAFYRDLMLSILNTHIPDCYQSYGVELIYKFFGIKGNYLLTNDKIERKYNELRVYVIPKALVYQYDCYNIDYAFNNALNINNFDSKAIGYHWYAGSDIAQRFNNLLNEDNYIGYKTTFSEIAREVLQNGGCI